MLPVASAENTLKHTPRGASESPQTGGRCSPSPPHPPGNAEEALPRRTVSSVGSGGGGGIQRKEGRKTRRWRERWSEGATELHTHVQGSAGSVASSGSPSCRFYRLRDGGRSCDWTSVSTRTTDGKTTNQNRSLIPDYVHDSPPPSSIN